MAISPSQFVGTFNTKRATAAAGTVFTALIRPYIGGVPGTAPTIHKSDVATSRGDVTTHVSRVGYRSGGTAHTVAIMRPLNYTNVNGAVAANATVINVAADPGVYSTAANWKYSLAATKPASIADNAIAAGDYCAYQLVDGTWILDTVASVATLAITMTTAVPNITGGGVADKTLFYFFGVVGDSDPSTGEPQPQFGMTGTAGFYSDWSDALNGVVAALHPGDPMMFYSPNGTAAGVLEQLSGYYLKR